MEHQHTCLQQQDSAAPDSEEHVMVLDMQCDV